MTNRRHQHDTMKIVQLNKVRYSRFLQPKLKAKNWGFILECHYTQISTETPLGGKPKATMNLQHAVD